MSDDLKRNDINKFCRICVKKSETLRCISDLEISEKLQICSNISIPKEDGFPDKICYSCELLLQATCRFQILCKTASEKWKKYVNSHNIIEENYKKKKEQKESTLKKNICYAIPEYVEVKPETKEYFLNEQVPELNIVRKGITNIEDYVISDSKIQEENCNELKNKLCSEPVEILLKRFDSEKFQIETNDDDIKLNTEDDDDKVLSYDRNESDYSNYDSDKSFKPESKLKKKKKVKMKHEKRKSSYETSNNYIDDYDETNRKVLRKERKSKTNPPKSKRKIFVAKIIPTREERQESSEDKISVLNGKFLQCFLCGQILENTNKFRKHLLFHERNKNKSIYNSLDLDPNEKVLCEICGLALENTSALQSHSMLHAEKFPYHCKLCPHRTRQAISLKIHMRKHTGEKPYACPNCRKVFSTSSNRLKHIRTKHTTGPDRPFQCEICKRHCSSKVTLENHLDSIHYKIKKHYCEHCNSGFYSRKRMLFHRRKVHNVSAEVKGRIPSYIQKEREKSKTN